MDRNLQVPARESIASLVTLASQLGAEKVSGVSTAELELLSAYATVSRCAMDTIQEVTELVRQGEDPLGAMFCLSFSNDERRPKGATYTPLEIVRSMLLWAEAEIDPDCIVDAGAGSGRFIVEAGRRFPKARLVAVEIDPLAALLARAHLNAAGMAERSEVILGDFRDVELEHTDGATLYIGNPPYVRHHLIGKESKDWLASTAARRGLEASKLAGLHVYFFLSIAERAKPGDVGVLVTASEWLDVNYGKLVRDLLVDDLGVENLQVIEPEADPFPGTQTTATITGFRIGTTQESVGVRRVATTSELGDLPREWSIGRERLKSASRWSPLTRPLVERREGFVELGELCRVHRGQVTGANRIWVQEGNYFKLPESVMFSSVTRARELFATEGVLEDASRLKFVVDLPAELDVFDSSELRKIKKFLRYAKDQGADQGFIARHRKAWWSVELRRPAPILATYMARRAPKFVLNLADARHINVAHGLYPRVKMNEGELTLLSEYLSERVSLHDGRTYAGGLTKFEPREMERLLVPEPNLLTSRFWRD